VLQPNLFAYATSELSQDAVLCWMLAWGDQCWKPAAWKPGRAPVPDRCSAGGGTVERAGAVRRTASPVLSKMRLRSSSSVLASI